MMIRTTVVALTLIGSFACGRRDSGAAKADLVQPSTASASGAGAQVAPIPGVLPTSEVVRGVSVSELGARFTDHRAKAFTLDAVRGHVTAIAMFYSTCPMACPRLIANVKAAEAELTPEERRELRVVLVTIDPENDTPQVLTKAMSKFGLDESRWTMLTGSEDDIRDLAAVLGIKYRDDDGSINHSSVITLLDREGKMDARFDGLVDTRAAQSRRMRELMAKH